MEMFIQVIGVMDKEMVREFIPLIMVMYIKVIIKMIKNMEKDF